MSPRSSPSPTPLLPKSANAVSLPSYRLPDTPNSPSFPSELPTPRSAGLRSLSLEDTGIKTPITPPSAYLEFLKTSIVMRTPTSATFQNVPHPPTSAPLSAGCTCRGRRPIKKPVTLKKPTTESNSNSNSSSRESSCDSNGSACCSNYSYFPPPTPYTPFTPSSMKTPLSGTKRLRIPPSPAFSPNYNAAFESPFPIYASATPRTPITEEDEEEMLENGILSANGERQKKSSACRHKKIITVRADAAGLSRTARMKLMAAPKGKKRRVD